MGSFINVNFSISPIYLSSDMRSKILGLPRSVVVHPLLVSIPKAARTSLFLLARNESAGRPEEGNIVFKSFTML